MPATWKQYGVDANGDDKKDPYNPVDAIFAAARYLRAAGAEQDLARAIFAYNHADWYVDSVLMRARLIGGLPTDLVGSLTGLTQGRFPVAARARYADDVDAREAAAAGRQGHERGVPDRGRGSAATSGSTRSRAPPSSRCRTARSSGAATRASSAATSELRDAFGNTYTYSHLGSLATRHPVLRDQPEGEGAACSRTRRQDPAPKQAASAGKQPAKPSASSPAQAAAPAPKRRPVKERLFASPAAPGRAAGRRRAPARVGGRRARTPSCSGCPPTRSRCGGCAVGSRVIGGTVLGRIGRTSLERVAARRLLDPARRPRRAAHRPEADPRRLEAARVDRDLPRAVAQPVLRARTRGPRRSARSC